MHRRRLASLVFLLAALLAGCGQPADPLDWRVDARTPAKFNAWMIATLPELPELVQQDFRHVMPEFAIISGNAGYVRNLDDANDPICRQINGKTVRYMLLDGYALELERRLRNVNLQSQIVVSRLQRTGASDNAKLERYSQAMASYEQDQIAGEKKMIEQIQARIAELRRRGP